MTDLAIADFEQGLLGYEPRIANILAAADAEQGCARTQAYAAMLHMLAETSAAPARARPYVNRAEAAARDADPATRVVVAATRAWVDDDVARAIAIGEEAAREHPRELALAKVTQYHLFNLGDAPGMLRVAGRVLDANRDVAYAHGLLAFAYEQCHLLADAEAAARDALAIRADEPWAQHALAHVLLTQGRNDEGRRFLEGVKGGWDGLNSFMHTHNWWHLALVQIEQGEAESVLDYYDTHIWGLCPTYAQDQVGAVSLLARLELAGVEVGDRWAEVATYLAARTHDHVQPFLSMQYLYGLARAGHPAADATLEAIRAAANAAPQIARAAWVEVCVPACEGILAHARGAYGRVVERLRPVLPRLREIGGSHAQRDLFEQIFVDALMQAGDLVTAQQSLEMRRGGNPHSAPTLRRLASVYAALGLPAEAARVKRQVAGG
jgi:hypothetical protein